MSNHLSLLRKSQSIISYLNHHLSIQTHNDLQEVFTMMRTMQTVFPQWVLLSCPAQHPGAFFITENSKSILGYSPADFTEMNHESFLLSKVHNDDLEDMHRSFTFIEKFLKDTMPQDYIRLRFVLQYRFQHKHGQYLTIQQEQAILPLKNSKPLYYSIIKDATADTIFSGVKLEIFKNDGVLEKLAEYFPAREGMCLSKRQQDIIGLMQTGLSTKQIAHRLSISQYTARNIKQKMFEKYKVNNSIALLNKAVY